MAEGNRSAFWGLEPGEAGSALWGQASEAQPGSGPLETPDAEDRYRRVTLVASGGMGSVWLGWDARLGRQVAIKLPRPDLPHAAERLRREASIAGRLDHPGMVVIHDVEVHAGQPYFVMAYVSGRPLADTLRASSTGEERTRLLLPLLEAVRAVAHAHAQGVIHRDLTPRNLLVGEDGAIRVIDWGLAWVEGDATDPPLTAGTPGYAAPEQRSAQVQAHPSADVWSLGQILRAVVFGLDEDGRPKTEGPCSPELLAIVDKATASIPSERYADASALERDLRAWLEGRRVEAYAMPRWRGALLALWRARKVLALLAVVAATAFGALAIGLGKAQQEAARALEAESEAQRAAEHAQVEEARAERALAEALAIQSREAWRRRDLVETRMRAEGALAIAPDEPLALGMLAMLAGLPEPEVLESTLLPHCARWALTAREDRMVCLQEEETVLHEGPPHFAPLARFDEPLMELRSDEAHLYYSLWNTAMTVMEAVDGREVRRFWAGPRFSDPILPVRFDPADGRSDLAHWPVAPCRSRVHATARAAEGTWFACGDRGVWWLDDQGHAEHHAAYADVLVRALAVDHVGRPWGATTSGAVVRLDGRSAGVRFFEPITSLVAHPTEPWLLARSWKGDISVIDVASEEVVMAFAGTTDEARVLDDGTVLILHGDRRVRYRLSTDRLLLPHVAEDGFASVAFSPDGRMLAGGNGSGSIHVLRLFDRPEDAEPSARRVHWVNQVVKDARFSSDGRVVLAVSAATAGILRMDVETGEAELVPKSPNWAAQALAVLGDGTTWIAPYARPMERLQGNTFHSLLEERLVARHVSAPHGATHAVSCGESIHLMHADGAEAVRVADPRGPWVLCASSETGVVAAVSEDRLQVLLLSDASGSEGRWLSSNEPIWSLVFTPAPVEMLALGKADGTVHLHDLSTLDRVAVLAAHEGRVSGVDVSPDGRLLASASWDGRIRFANLSTLHAVGRVEAELNDPFP